MKALPARYLAAFFILLVFQLLVVFIVVISTFAESGGIAGALYEFFRGWSVSREVFDFIAGRPEIFSGVIVFLAVVLFAIMYRMRDRKPALRRLHKWATDAVVELSQYQQEQAENDARSGNYEGLETIVRQLAVHEKEVLADARFVGGEVKKRVRGLLDDLHDIENKVNQQYFEVFADIRAFQNTMADIMLLTFDMMS